MAALTPRDSADPRHLEAVINDLAGAASVAAAILDHIRSDPNAAEAQSLEEGLGWLALRLNTAAENALAVQRRHAPRWRTLMEAEDIAAAVGAAIAAANAREAGE
ncbi:hypothetical protein [Roseococcus suduntuyensis]|uniref:Putative PhzF superfamily epimerase YddE/YHI9 n=1 Tax=Roseococcus suduntuyensis TaxID=455361 RepID=A0A840AGU0_9PROT|nr:hypothetical protein [Roseococcus suduntuyensis]MBB3900102.1 putative PhzF superfamily epimerase YddE/YHI9 [Roseococcus suduntuyensis]